MINTTSKQIFLRHEIASSRLSVPRKSLAFCTGMPIAPHPPRPIGPAACRVAVLLVVGSCYFLRNLLDES